MKSSGPGKQGRNETETRSQTPKPEMVAHTALGIRGKAGLSYKATKFLSQNTKTEKPNPT